MARPARYLGLLVDSSIVMAVYLIKLEEGIIAYWPPEELDDEAVMVADFLSVPLRQGLYFIVGGDKLENRYVGLVIGNSVLLFKIGSEVPAEVLAENLSRTYMVFLRQREGSQGNITPSMVRIDVSSSPRAARRS